MMTNHCILLSFFMTLFIFGVHIIQFSCSQTANSCSNQRCNCEVNNGDILQSLIESIVNQSLNERLPASVEEAVENKFQDVQQQINDSIDEKIVDSQRDMPVVKLLYLVRASDVVALKNISIANGLQITDEIARINFSPSSSSTSSNNILAYRLSNNFVDIHTSGLAAFFVNIQTIYPCLIRNPSPATCKIFTFEDDGFRNGHAFIESADGTSFGVFGNNATFAFALSGCPIMNDDCFPNSGEYSIVCLLPRSWCS